jgi:hypothetical protein
LLEQEILVDIHLAKPRALLQKQVAKSAQRTVATCRGFSGVADGNWEEVNTTAFISG